MSFSSKSVRVIASAAALGVLGFAGNVRAQDADLSELVKGAQERAKKVQITAEPKKWDDEERVQKAAEAANQRGREALEAMLAKRAAPAQSTPVGEPSSDAGDTKPKKAAAKLPGRLVVALSSSMPETQLREYFRQLDGMPEAIVVLRGFVGGARTVQPTGQWIEKMRRKKADCLECGHFAVETVVDPLTYRGLKITKVPAFSYLPNVENLSHCDEADWSGADVVYGATTVRAALDALAKSDARVPRELIRRLGGV